MGENGRDERCIVCHPDAKTPDGEYGFDHFCSDHTPPKEVAVEAWRAFERAEPELAEKLEKHLPDRRAA